MSREILFYRTMANKCPVEEFLDALPAKVAQKVTWVLQLVEDLDMVPSKYFVKMPGTDNIWECRIKLGSNIYRIFAFWDANKVVLTHGFVKKTQRTPDIEITRAENYKKDYFERQRR